MGTVNMIGFFFWTHIVLCHRPYLWVFGYMDIRCDGWFNVVFGMLVMNALIGVLWLRLRKPKIIGLLCCVCTQNIMVNDPVSVSCWPTSRTYIHTESHRRWIGTSRTMIEQNSKLHECVALSLAEALRHHQRQATYTRRVRVPLLLKTKWM